MADKGRGRGSLLDFLRKAREMAEQPSQDSSEASVSQSIQPSVLPQQSRGRANLLALHKKLAEAKDPGQQPREGLPQVAVPQQSKSRGALLKIAQQLSSPGGTPSCPLPKSEASSRVMTSGDGGGVLGRLSLLNLDDNSQKSLDSSMSVCRQGTSGDKIGLTANYIDLTIDPNKGIFRYEVKFSPEIDAIYLRRDLLNQHSEALGTVRTFDGALLYLPIQLPQSKTIVQSIHPNGGTPVELTIIFQKKQPLSESILFFNVLLSRVMRALQLVRIGRNDYNPRCAHAVPEHRMELWPGYVTTIDEYQGGLKLNINASHRVMRIDTVRDFMAEAYRNSRANARDVINAEILGLTVLTRYNNRTYRVDDIEWDKNPKFSFERKNEMISIVQYYKSHYNIDIKDLEQPLLVHRYKRKTTEQETIEEQLLLVPELCYLTGLTDKLRADFRLMRDLAKVTQVGPEARRRVILSFVQDVKKNSVAREILEGWGLRLAEETVQVAGRRLDPETIIFGNQETCKSDKADWSAVVTSKAMLRTPHMTNWCILSTEKDSRVCYEFVSMLKRVAKNMCMNINDPKYIKLNNDRTEAYITEIRRVISPDLQMVVALCPFKRADRYSAIKKLCCTENPVRSQVIVTRTISQANKLRSVSEKIALQINCKLGGALWALKMPFDNCMICGIDVFHAAAGEKSKGSVAAFVSSLDKPLTSWYSRTCFQRSNQELIDMLKICLVASIQAYAKKNGMYPQRIIIYRDGVGDSDLHMLNAYEVPQLQTAVASIEENYTPMLTVVVVQKRINTRIMATMRNGLQNPPAGTIVDSVVTRRNWFDFFLIPQTSHQGTVSPTHYIVVHDSANMKADHVQRLTFKLCHLYYNWPGTVSVPAPCQYAHKLAYLVGQSVGQQVSEALAHTLYYL